MSKPFIKWAGGKYKLATHLSNYLPKNFSDLQYFEPMIGGGGMFFHLKPDVMKQYHLMKIAPLNHKIPPHIFLIVVDLAVVSNK